MDSYDKPADDTTVKTFRRSLSDGYHGNYSSSLNSQQQIPQVHFLKKHLSTKDENQKNVDVINNDFILIPELNVKNISGTSRQQQQRVENDDESSKNLNKSELLPQAPSSCPSAIDTDVFLEESAEESAGFMPNMGNLKKLRRSWRQRANTLGGTLVQGMKYEYTVCTNFFQ